MDYAMTVLKTARLKLRRARLDDIDAMHAILSHPVAMRYWSTLPHTSIEESRAWLESMIDAPPDESDDFIVEQDGSVIGKAGFWRFPEIGYILHPDAWGKGLATEALSAVIAHGFETRNLEVIKADVDPRNHASLRLLQKLGFVETGRASSTILIGDEWCDSVYLVLERSLHGIIQPASSTGYNQ